MSGYLTHFGLSEAKTPYSNVVPELTAEQFAELESDMADGFDEDKAIVVDEEGNILDGRHRQRIHPDCPFRIKRGLKSDAEKRLFALKENKTYRGMSKGQKTKCETARKDDVLDLLRQGKNATEVSYLSGIPRRTINDWSIEAGTSKPRGHNTRKLSDEQVEEIKDRIASGETQSSIANDLGVVQSRIAQIISGGGPPPLITAKRTDPVCDRAVAARSAISAGQSASSVTAKLGFFSEREYRKAAAIAESGITQLIEAVNAGVIGISGGEKLLKKTPEEIVQKVGELTKSRMLKDQKKRGCAGKSASEVLVAAINSANMSLRTYANHGVNKREIPRSEKKKSELVALLDSFEKTVTMLLSDLRRELGCS